VLGRNADYAHREDLREQHAIGEEIGEAITQSIGNQGLDESELDEELEALQQEELDNKMLHTGNVPVADQIGRLPSAPEAGELIFIAPLMLDMVTDPNTAVKSKAPAREEEEDEEEELRKLQAEMAM
jgi:charged multivesicular body protein 4